MTATGGELLPPEDEPSPPPPHAERRMQAAAKTMTRVGGVSEESRLKCFTALPNEAAEAFNRPKQPNRLARVCGRIPASR